MNNKGMLSGSIIGAILRAYSLSKRERWQESYKDLAAIAAVWAVIMFGVSLVILFLGNTIVGTFFETGLSWILPENILSTVTTVTSFGIAVWRALLIGIVSYASLFTGALVVDIAVKIKESI